MPVKKRTPIFSPEEKYFLNILKGLLAEKANDFKIPAPVIATTADLEELLLTKEDSSKISEGWRYDIFGKVASIKREEFLRGLSPKVS